MIESNGTHFQVFENCVARPLEGDDEDWKPVMQLLELQVGYLEPVQTVLRQGAWRNASDPVRYIRAAARREYRKLDGPKRPRELVGCISELKLPRNQDGTPMHHDDAIDLLNAEPLEADWDTQYAREWVEGKRRVHRRFLIADSPYEDAHYTVDYSKLMDEVSSIAGLSKPRRETIEKVLGWLATWHISREQILTCPDQGERKRLQAALKWVQRNKALLAKVLSGRP